MQDLAEGLTPGTSQERSKASFEFPGTHYWQIDLTVYRPITYTQARLEAIATTLRNEGHW